MRGLGALIAINRLLLASAFISPIPNVFRSIPGFQTANRRHTPSSPAALRRVHLSSTRVAEVGHGGGGGDEKSAILQSGKPVLSFPGGGIFFWVSA